MCAADQMMTAMPTTMKSAYNVLLSTPIVVTL